MKKMDKNIKKMINSDFIERGPQPHLLKVDFKSLDETFVKNFNLELLYQSYLKNKIYEKLSKAS